MLKDGFPEISCHAPQVDLPRNGKAAFNQFQLRNIRRSWKGDLKRVLFIIAVRIECEFNILLKSFHSFRNPLRSQDIHMVGTYLLDKELLEIFG